MREMKIFILTILLTSNLVAQEWYDQIKDQHKLIQKITEGENWEDILEYGLTEIKSPKSSTNDISETIQFSKSSIKGSIIDEFFHNICDSTYSEFPYRRSGHLTKDLYITPKKDTSRFALILSNSFGKSLYPEFAQIINIDENELIPKLIEYLKNDAATRLCIKSVDWDELPFYLSISDVAMELLEVKTYCDFFDNASHSSKLFSNLSEIEKEKVINDVEKLVKFKRGKTQFQKIEYFLDSISAIGHSYRFTCHNLLFSGDTIAAKKMYIKFYEQTEMPCSQDFKVGEILLELGDRRMLYDCSDKIYNYKCTIDGWEGLGRNCIEMFFNSDKAWFRDDVFAEIIATEPHSNYRNGDIRNLFGIISSK
jgi:hypothetical protein